MSRVIKFRIWNGKKMLFPNAIDGFVTGIDNHTCYCSNDGWWDIKPSELMQYTGLKDKNGVDSYGSDLCEYSYEINCDVTCGIETVLLLIKWDDVDFRWGFYDALNGDFYCNLADLRPDEFEIVGNIHTTPELLK